MDSNLPAATIDTAGLQNFSEAETITPDYYLTHYAEFLPRYIAKGSPSQDTMNNYCSRINRFIRWCIGQHRHPMSATDYTIRLYDEYLVNRNYAPESIQCTIVSLNAFFHAAQKLGLIKENPCADVEAPSHSYLNQPVYFYTPEQIREICKVFQDAPDDFVRLRNTAIVYLMAVEGLRNVEVQRACLEDIDWDRKIMTVRGKGSRGRRDPIYPCDTTIEILRQYILSINPEKQIKKDGAFTPLILSDSPNNEMGRISRNGIRWIMNKALKAANLKHPGFSCHILRHSCGTNLYQQTKDLRLVQDTLRHKDPKVTSRYAHLADRLERRATSTLADMIQAPASNPKT